MVAVTAAAPAPAAPPAATARIVGGRDMPDDAVFAHFFDAGPIHASGKGAPCPKDMNAEQTFVLCVTLQWWPGVCLISFNVFAKIFVIYV
jgi:hypothetical protein